MSKQPRQDSRAIQELREREQVADSGESAETPAILIGDIWVVVSIAFLVVLAISLLAYRLAT